MPPEANGPSPPSGLTLYANLLKPSAGQISSAPVMYNQKTEAQEEEAAAKPSKTDFRQQLFQQKTKRPQQKKTNGPRPAIPVPTSSVVGSSSSPDRSTASNPVSNAQPVKSVGPVTTTTAADWISREEDDNEYLEFARPAKPKKRKKNKKENESQTEIDWDAPYDPTKPTNYELYKDSDEALADDNEWWNKLHAHQLAVKEPRVTRSASAEDDGAAAYASRNRAFAPPVFDSPARDVTMGGNPSELPRAVNGMSALPSEEDEEAYRPSFSASQPAAATGEDAWAQRAALGAQFAPPNQQPSSSSESTNIEQFPAIQLGGAAALLKAVSSSTISRAPVQYERPVPNEEEENNAAMDVDEESPADDADAPRSNRPGQRDFAKRLLMKHGWKEGQGLGATGSGMLKPLRVQLDKRVKKSDAEGGGFRNRGGTGKIIGGKKPKGIVEDEDVLGKMSEVVVILGALDGVDIAHEIEEGLYQNIGDECNQKYGSVARIVINPDTRRIFVKFTQSLSALRAVQALNTKGVVEALQGRNAEGSVATSCYYVPELFERGVFDAKLKIEEQLKAEEEAAAAKGDDMVEA